MAMKRGVRRTALVLVLLVVSTGLGSATAMATELNDYRWESRPLLVFAPTATDPRLLKTLSRIDASRCDFISRDMVLGQVVAEGNSTLDGNSVDADEARRLTDRFAIGPSAFSVVLIGKDGGEKLRVDAVPDLQAIYAVVDGMPMRSRELATDPGRC